MYHCGDHMEPKKRRRDPERTQVARSTYGSVRSPLALKAEMEVFPSPHSCCTPFATGLSALVLPLPSHKMRRRREMGQPTPLIGRKTGAGA